MAQETLRCGKLMMKELSEMLLSGTVLQMGLTMALEQEEEKEDNFKR